MAESVLLSALPRLVFQKSASLIEQGLGKIWGAGANVKRELQKLQGTLSIIGGVLQDAEEKQVKGEALRLWLLKLKDAAYDADDLLEDFNLHLMRRQRMEDEFQGGTMMMKRSKVCDFFSSSHNPILFYARMERRVKEVRGRIDELAAERSQFDLRTNDSSVNVLPATNYSRPPTHSYVPESDVIGREADVEMIVQLLIGQENEKKVAVLPIVGMAGLGKTTLLQMVYNDQRVMDHFKLRMWVSVPDDFPLDKIVNIMIEAASGSESKLSNMDLLQLKLREVIGARRYMLALDDVWNEDPMKWEALKILLTFGGHGSAVVVTTRNKKVSSIMGTLSAYQLAGLSDDDSWILFNQRAFMGREENPNLVEIGRAIVNKCGGVPLAAKVLGCAMSLKSEEREWRSVMESEIWDLQAGQKDILPALRLSYHHLPPHLKQCFAYCAIFPRGYEIEKEMLIELWLANGFISSDARIMESEFGGNAIFDELQQRSFFQDVKEVKKWPNKSTMTTCKMHDLIHDLTISIMRHECSVLDKWEDISSTKFRHLVIDYGGGGNRRMGAASSSSDVAVKTVRTLLFHILPFSDRPQRFVWPNTKYLRVLSLQDIGMLEFPLSICDLRHLRYLDLSHNGFKTIPEAISRLFNLQTLNLSFCGSLLRLPKSMRYMSSLMHLHLEGYCWDLRSMPSVGKLRHLKTLTMYIVAGKEGAERCSIGDLKDLNLHGMLHLRNLKNVETAADAEEANLGSKENLHHLILDWEMSDRAVSDATEFRSRSVEEVLQALQPHQNLKYLKIAKYQGTKLPTWLMGESMILANLVKLVLVDCRRCEHLPQLWRLPFLEVLKIKRMGGCKFYDTASVVQDDTTIFPSLRKLQLCWMRNLEELPGVEGRPSFPIIEDIDIVDCPELRTMTALPSARVLRIIYCPLLRPAKGFFGCMKSLVKLTMDLCDELIMMLGQEDGPIDSLLHLAIRNCQQLMFLSPLSKYFNCLQTLEISNCELPVHVFQGLSTLRSLQLWSLSSSSSEGLQFQGLPALEDLTITLRGSIRCFHPECLRHITTLKSLYLYGNHHEVASLPEFPEFIQLVSIKSCWGLISLPEGLGRLAELERFIISDLPMVTSLPEEEIQGYKSLKFLEIEECRSVVSLPVGLQQRLPTLASLTIKGCPDLERCCKMGGEYWHLVQSIPNRVIGYG